MEDIFDKMSKEEIQQYLDEIEADLYLSSRESQEAQNMAISSRNRPTIAQAYLADKLYLF